MKRGAETKQQTARRFVGRSALVLSFFFITAAALLARAVYLQVLNKDFLNEQGDSRHIRKEKITAHRGSIIDRNGEPLAISTPVDSVWVNPREFVAAVDRVPELAASLGMDQEKLMRRITSSLDREFLYLKRHLSPAEARRVMALELPGINVHREYRRFYPAGEVAGHLVGFNNVDDEGQEGLELAYNHWLSGVSGAKRVLKDRLGRAVEDVESIRPARHGRDLQSSIDLRLQYLSYRTLKAAIRQHEAASGSIVILDIRTGEVLAIVNQPSYNPNDRAQYSPERYRNRAITDIFEPGSSIKPLIVAAALESGAYQAASIIDTNPGSVVVGPKKIEDSRNLGRIPMTTVLSRSSNVGATKIAMSLQAEQLWAILSRFGLGSLTSSGFPGESAGLLTHYDDWREISQATLGYGYGVSVTPLQLVQAFAALGSGGEIRPVSLVRLEEPAKAERIVAPDTAVAVLDMMEDVVSPGGTGAKAVVAGYRIAGKTGTAWKSEAGGYSEDKYFSVFAGLAPASDPRLAAVVIVDEPTGDLYYGSDVAAPVFATIMTESLRLLAIPPDDLPARDSGIIVQAMSE